MERLDESVVRFRNYLLEETIRLADTLQPKSSGFDKALRKIRATEDVETIQDHMAPLRVRRFFLAIRTSSLSLKSHGPRAHRQDHTIWSFTKPA